MDTKAEWHDNVRTDEINDNVDQRSGTGQLDPTGVLVKPKWRGTSQDKTDMEVLGRHQVLRGHSDILFIGTNGGTADLFWGYIVVLIGSGLTYASLAEMASMAPSAAGQYHWVSEFAPPRYQKFLSYIVGWICMMGWQAGLLSVGFIVGTIIQGLIVLNNPSYVFERWHGTLLVWAITAFCVVFNTFLAKRLPAIEGVVLVIHMLGLFAVIVPLWILSPRATAAEALLTFTNGGGWPTTGLSAMIGLLTPMGSLCGFDCAVHMSEEVEDAGRTVPRSIMWSVYLNGAMGFLMAITMCFCLGDLSEVVDSPTGYPFIQVFYNATQSYAATNVLVAIMIITLTACCVSEVATSSRQLWSFARDKGIPFSDWFAQVSTRMHIPLRAVLVSMMITCLVSLINIGSTVALNAIVSLSIVSLLTSYYITIACLIWRRLHGAPLPVRRWSLGRYGLAINVASLLFLTPIYFFAFWPPVTPVQPNSMNWAVVMYAGVIVWALVYYFVWGRDSYVGPVAIVKREV
ncbi:MAG: hypothetical protein HETSPECPRED_005709 [Heterodermia speciosa]|uniref:Amino acid transporter n=1 Tax=Heterodermia speciosa TaxID=116794 RepID=A0A8H3FF93_9LECA|nr:MAG: hypothetical protein HETSPECPRED_005709 [Heterodermia speciosa]